MKPQSAQRKTLCSQKGSSLKDKIQGAQLLTYLKAIDKRVVLLINFDAERLKNVIKRLIIKENAEGEDPKIF
jgi:hypothetical protein